MYEEYIVRVYDNGSVEWRNKEGKLHRKNGPAREFSNGSKFWYLNGELHREDGPASECYTGYKAWYTNGELHREDGPAIEYVNGDKEWFLNGEKLTEEEFNKRTKKCEEKIITIDGEDFKLVKVEK